MEKDRLNVLLLCNICSICFSLTVSPRGRNSSIPPSIEKGFLTSLKQASDASLVESLSCTAMSILYLEHSSSDENITEQKQNSPACFLANIPKLTSSKENVFKSQ